jgi:hypothetical protein
LFFSSNCFQIYESRTTDHESRRTVSRRAQPALFNKTFDIGALEQKTTVRLDAAYFSAFGVPVESPHAHPKTDANFFGSQQGMFGC